MKSASFGSRIFVVYKGLRSPDLSCPGQTEPLAEALHTDLEEIISEARKTAKGGVDNPSGLRVP